MSDLLYALNSLIPDFDEFLGMIGLFVLMYGVINAFFGYKLFKILLSIVGFLVGAVIGAAVFFYAGGGSSGIDAVELYILVGGIIGSILAEVFHSLGVFLTVGAAGMVVAFLATQDRDTAVIVGVICGIVGVILEKYAIIVSSGLSGGTLAAAGYWLIGVSNGKDRDVVVMGWLIAIAGIVFQLLLERWVPTKAEEQNKPRSGARPMAAAGARTGQTNAAASAAGSAPGPQQAAPAAGGAPSPQQAAKEADTEAPAEWVYCTACGAKLSPTAQFCSQCGARQELD